MRFSTSVTLLLLLLPLLPLQGRPTAETGSIAGVVIDKKSREPLTGATIQLNNSSTGTVADPDGKFRIDRLTPGRYTVRVQYISYETREIPQIAVSSGKETVLEIELDDNMESLSEVVVVAQVRKSGDAGLLSASRTSLVVQSGVSAQQIVRTQDRDASEVAKRIPGITLMENKFINVRGLSQRYNNVWINNSGVPSSEADSRAFSFDIIPSSQIDNLVVVKSPAPELPADFSGGFVQINTKDVPDENRFALSIGTSVNDETHFRNFRYHRGSGTDLLGFDDGKRALRNGFPNRIDNDDAAQVTRFTRNGFNNNWRVRERTPWGDLRLNAELNRIFDLENGKRIALLSSLNYTNAYRTMTDMKNARYGIYNAEQDEPTYLYKYSDNQYSHDVRLGGMLNLTFLPNGSRDKYEFKNIVNQLGRNRYTERSGYQNISGFYVQEKQEYLYTSRTTYSGQFTGTHNREGGLIAWGAGYAYANKRQPDRRLINREENTFVTDERYGELMIDQNEIQRDFTSLDEHIVSGNFNYTKEWRAGIVQPSLKTGVYAEYRSREFSNRTFFYRYNEANLPDGFAYLPVVEEILGSDYFGADRLYVYEDTDNRNSYRGNNLLLAGYAGLNLAAGPFNLYAGVRYEYNDMGVTSYLSIREFGTQTLHYRSGDLFPSVNATYKLTARQQLRLAYGASVNRPEFRELSPSVYYDFDLFSDIKGNPDLKTAYIQNADLRYEFYPAAGEVVSAALFFKHFSNPIEWSYLDAGGSYTYTFENAKSAVNAGIEVEIVKNLGFLGLSDFSWSFNGAYILSEVAFAKGSLEKDRPMQGQSPYIVNSGLFYKNDRLRLNAGILYNRIGKRIVGVGRVDTSTGASINNDIPDAYEMPRNAIDLTFGKRFGKGFEVKASVRDLLAESVVFKQFPRFVNEAREGVQERSQTTRRFRPGRNFFVSLSYQF